jgi:hypothetical protein
MRKNVLIEEHEKINFKKKLFGREGTIVQEMQKKVFTEDENAPKKKPSSIKRLTKRKR